MHCSSESFACTWCAPCSQTEAPTLVLSALQVFSRALSAATTTRKHSSFRGRLSSSPPPTTPPCSHKFHSCDIQLAYHRSTDYHNCPTYRMTVAFFYSFPSPPPRPHIHSLSPVFTRSQSHCVFHFHRERTKGGLGKRSKPSIFDGYILYCLKFTVPLSALAPSSAILSLRSVGQRF